MVDTFIQLPSDGTGHKVPAISTLIGANTIVVPITLIAGLKTYVAAVINSANAANKNHIILFNGVGSGDIIRVWDIKANPNITGNVAVNSIVLNTARTSDSGTGGASLPIRKTDTQDGNLPAQITATGNPTAPTITSNELASCTMLIEETNVPESRATLFKADSVIAPLVLNEGQGLLVQQGTNAGIGATNIFMYFTID